MAAADEDRSVCAPCRGTGKLVSGKGGTPHEVRCPWCEGGGKVLPDHDAQRLAPSPAA